MTIAERRKADYEAIQGIWHLLRDYGDLGAGHDQDARWAEFGRAATAISERGHFEKELCLLVMKEIDRRATGK